MTTDQFINEITTEMAHHLTSEQILILKNVMAERLFNIEFKEIDTSVSTIDKSNEYYLEMFIACKSVDGCSEKTLEQYYFKIKQFYTEAGVNLVYVNTNHIRAYLYKMAKTRNWSKSTQEGSRRALSSFYDWMVNEEYIDRNPCKKIKGTKIDDTNVRILTSDEIEIMREHCINQREKAMIELLVSTGMRCNEIRILKVSDIDFDRRTISIFGKGNKRRTGYLNSKAFIAIKKMLEEKKYKSIYVFSRTRNNNKLDTPMTKGTIEDIVKKIADRAGLGRVVIHNFRHYFASELCRKNMNLVYIQELMGHSSINTTRRIYTHVQNDTLHNEYNKFAM